MHVLADPLLALLAGVLVGLVVTWVLLRRSATARARDRFEAWRAGGEAGIRRTTLAAARGGIKADVGTGLAEVGLAAVMETLPFEAADLRFVGDPVTFVVFDGHTEVKDRASPALRGVSFVTVTDRHRDPADPGLLVAECVAGGRVEWLTVRI